MSVDAMENGEKGFVDVQLKDFGLRLIPCFLVIGINMKSKESQGETVGTHHLPFRNIGEATAYL